MTTDTQGKVDLKAGIDYLFSTEDPMLVELANNIKTSTECPNEEELTQILIFFLTFSIGCSSMELFELAGNFNKRAKQFIVALGKFGMHSGRLRNPIKKTWEPLVYNRIVNKATAIVAYKIAGSVNKF